MDKTVNEVSNGKGADEVLAYVLGRRDLNQPNRQQTLYELIGQLNRRPYRDYPAIADSLNE